MASRIKGITVEIGGDTSGLEKSLAAVNNSIKKTQSQLRDVYNLLKLDLILSRLVDTFISRISLTMLPVPNPHNTACVLSWEEARHWQSRSSGYSSS